VARCGAAQKALRNVPFRSAERRGNRQTLKTHGGLVSGTMSFTCVTGERRGGGASA
jgi:hypothetical protein